MNKIIKQIIAGASAALLLISSTVNVFAYTPRTTLTAVDCQSIYWDNIFQRNWSLGGGNCTWYAYGRAWELLGKKPNLSVNGAHKWYTYNDGYERGSEPRLGAVACWSDADSTIGHVAIVEKIDGDSITFSESGWSYTNSYFAVKTRNKNNMDYSLGGVTRHFQGYIYLPIADSTPVNAASSSDEKKVIPETKPMVNITEIERNEYGSLYPKSNSGIKIYINGKYMSSMSDYADNIDNTVMVPARDLLESFCGQIYWEDSTKQLTSYVNESVFIAQVNSNYMFLNGKAVRSNVPVSINSEGKMMLPLRAAVTMLGARIVSVDDAMNINIAY